MNNDTLIKYILKIFISLVLTVSSINLFTGKYSIQNFFYKKNELKSLEILKKEKIIEQKKLLHKIRLTNDVKAEIQKTLIIKKLYKIPKDFFKIKE